MQSQKYPNNDHEGRIVRLEVIIENINNTLIHITNRLERLEDKIDSNFKWLLGLYMGGFTALLGVMAHGFHWL